MRADELLSPRPEGLYCPPGDFYIDPVRPVERALITHGHADHARAGHDKVLATAETLDIMAIRYGQDFAGSRQTAELGQSINVNGVEVLFNPAGHVLGSAQISVRKGGLRIVASGDYKRRPDATCASFEVTPCDVFITEATFGLPVFNHPEDTGEVAKLLRSIKHFGDRTHLLGAYSLGKAQRLISLLRQAGYDEAIYIHGAFANLCDYYQSRGISLGTLQPATVEKAKTDFSGKLVLGPPSAFSGAWSRRFQEPLICYASGWMRVRQRAKQQGIELPMIISDHADWTELTQTIRDTGAGEIWVTHGREEALVRWCELSGMSAKPLNLVGYQEENE